MLVITSDNKTQLVYRNDDRRCQYVREREKGYSETMTMLVIPSDDKTQLVYRNDDRCCQYQINQSKSEFI